MITKKYKAGDITITAGKGGGDPLTRVDTLPEPSEETYNENKIYENNNNLSYIGKEIPKGLVKTDIPGDWKSKLGSLDQSGSSMFQAVVNDNMYIIQPEPTLQNMWKIDLKTGNMTEIPNSKLIVFNDQYGVPVQRVCPTKCEKTKSVYFMGFSSTFKDVIKFDTTTNTFSKVGELSEMCGNDDGWQSCYDDDHYIYMINNGNTSILRYDVDTNICQKIGNRTSGYSYVPGLFVVDHYLYYQAANDLRRYDLLTNKDELYINWYNSINPQYNYAAGVFGGNLIFVSGGLGSKYNNTGDIVKVDLTTKEISKFGNVGLSGVDDSVFIKTNGSATYKGYIYCTNLKWGTHNKNPSLFKLGKGKPTYSSIPVGGLKITRVKNSLSISDRFEAQIPTNTKIIIIERRANGYSNGTYYSYGFSEPIIVTQRLLDDIKTSSAADPKGVTVSIINPSVSGATTTMKLESAVLTELTDTSIKIKINNATSVNILCIS